MREVGSTNVALGHLPLEATSNELEKKEILFGFFDKSEIRDFWWCNKQCYVRVKIGGKVDSRIWWYNLMAYSMMVWPDGKKNMTWWYMAWWYNLINSIKR